MRGDSAGSTGRAFFVENIAFLIHNVRSSSQGSEPWQHRDLGRSRSACSDKRTTCTPESTCIAPSMQSRCHDHRDHRHGTRLPQRGGGPEVPGRRYVTVNARGEDRFDFDVAISSPYDTPQWYADAFHVTGWKGVTYGERRPLHDHASEQPFTHELYGVYEIRAHSSARPTVRVRREDRGSRTARSKNRHNAPMAWRRICERCGFSDLAPCGS